jgi:hypothetical protein
VAFPTVAQSTVAHSTVENRPDNIKLIPKKTKSKKTKIDNTKGFDEFYKIYPKRADPALAKRSFESALKRATFETILQGAQRYRDDPNREQAFTKNPSTWLNADAWENDPLPPRITRKTRALTNAEEGVLLIEQWRTDEARGTQNQIEYDMGLQLKGIDDE